MKILYGAHGTGNGHISRAYTLAKAFAQRHDVEIDYLFSGRDRSKYFDMEIFGNYTTKDGISFVYRKGCKHHWKTIKALKPWTFYKDIRNINLSPYDLVISDGEPVSAWAAKLRRKPSISISHLVSYYCDEVPNISRGYPLIDKFVTKHLSPSNVRLGVFWYHFGANNLLPPFVEVCNSYGRSNADTYLVYLPFEHIEDIAAVLKPFKGIKFFCYHPDIEHERDEGHIKWCALSKNTFKEHLFQCIGVIANAGFYLASECLHFGKKLLMKPLLGQWEQLTNASLLTRLGLGHSMDTLNTQKIEEWLELPNAQPVVFPHDPAPLIDWIVAGDWHDTASICKTLWTGVQFPSNIQENLWGWYT